MSTTFAGSPMTTTYADGHRDALAGSDDEEAQILTGQPVGPCQAQHAAHLKLPPCQLTRSHLVWQMFRRDVIVFLLHARA